MGANLMINSILVTGGEGYIGSILCPMLSNFGYKVSSIDTNYFSEEFSNYCNLNRFINYTHKDIRLINLDDFYGVDCVIHLAALSNDPMGELDPYLTQEINYLSSVRLAALAKISKVKRFLFSSSCSVYGSTDFIANETSVTNPLTSYAFSKLRAEAEISKLADENFSPIFLRNATVYGLAPKFRVDLAVNNLTAFAYTKNQVLLKSDGKSIRPFIHVKDLARIFTYLATIANKELIHNEIFNIGQNKENLTIKEVADIISLVSGKDIVFDTAAQPDKRNYKVDFSKFKSVFPDFKFNESIKSAVEELWNFFSINDFSEYDINVYTRLYALKNLLSQGIINSQLYWE